MNFGALVLGGNVFGWTVSRDQAFTILDAFVDQGGTAIDTADLYPAWASHGGHSEEIIGEWLARSPGKRSKLMLCTKVAKWAEQPGLSASNIAKAAEGSLKRLRTDYIDLYYAHEDDHKVPQLETARGFDVLVRAGKVRALGASNFSPERLLSALAVAAEHQLAKYEVSQDHWNLVERDVERSLVPVLEKTGLKELPYFSLASGFLTGKYRPGTHVTSARSGAGDKYLSNPKNQVLLRKLDAIAAAHGVSVTAVALAWLRAQPTVAAPIASARTREQLDALLDIVVLTKEELAQLS